MDVAPSSLAKQTLVTIATYNEIDNLPRLIAELHRQVPLAHVLVVDDNSPDGTGRWVAERVEADPRIHYIGRPGKLGLGTATIAALRYGLEQGFEFLLNMDADFSHHPRHVPAMLAEMELAGDQAVDVVIGSRYVRGGGVEGWPWRRRWMSWAVNLYARLLLGLPVHDTSGAFRCYRAAILRRLDFGSIRSRGYSFEEEILWHLKRAGARFAEVPITFADRERGVSKINLREAVSALGTIFRLGIRNWLGC